MKNPQTTDTPYLRQLKPSLALALPAIILYGLLAMTLVFALAEFKAEVVLVSGWLGFDGPVSDNYALLLLLLSAGCALPPFWKVLQLLTTRYDISSEMLYYTRGVLNSRRDQIEVARIRDLSTLRPFPLRLVGLGHLQVDSVDTTHPQLYLYGMRNVNELKTWLHSLNVQERQRTGYREFGSAYAVPE